MNTPPDLKPWIGKTAEARDVITPRLIEAFRATLSPQVHKSLGGLHWCLAPDIADASALGPDGHPTKGGFLPPVPLPIRMWAASDTTFYGDLREGAEVLRRSVIANVESKQGRSGSLMFVKVKHAYLIDGVTVIEEDQTIVYREMRTSNEGLPPNDDYLLQPVAEHAVEIDPVTLFRYSALTFNGHRIHYDFPYATAVEGYKGLVIHGPLQATYLLNCASQVGSRRPKSFSFRATRPAIGEQRMTMRAIATEEGCLRLEMVDAGGRTTMEATAKW